MQYAVRGVGAWCLLLSASVIVLALCLAAYREPTVEHVFITVLVAVLAGLAVWAANDLSQTQVYYIPAPPRDDGDPQAGLEDDPELSGERVRVRVTVRGRFHLLEGEVSDGNGGWKRPSTVPDRTYRPRLRLVSNRDSL